MRETEPGALKSYRLQLINAKEPYHALPECIPKAGHKISGVHCILQSNDTGFFMEDEAAGFPDGSPSFPKWRSAYPFFYSLTKKRTLGMQ